MAWVEQIREVEDSLIAIISLDGDIVTEALANLPADARGRLQTMLALAEEAAAMSGVGHHYVIDTGLGPAVYHISSEDEDEPAAVPFFWHLTRTARSSLRRRGLAAHSRTHRRRSLCPAQ